MFFPQTLPGLNGFMYCNRGIHLSLQWLLFPFLHTVVCPSGKWNIFIHIENWNNQLKNNLIYNTQHILLFDLKVVLIFHGIFLICKKVIRIILVFSIFFYNTVKHGYNKHTYNELKLTAKWFLFPVTILHVINLTDI